ncbi:hypothetical protein VTN00DRAFT_2370 [Thermoascus crustaceus]|uniref:uncharacterized protein n=1 Tax=Thermoascus crustaceus TaxID=5088 RepID=UPI003743BA30
MAWASVGPEAWNEDQDKIGRGLLHDSPNWKPIYPAWDMAGVPFDWKNPEEPEDDEMTDEEFRALMEQVDRETRERMARREGQEELMKEVKRRRGN